MASYFLLIPIFVSFFVTLFLVPYWMRKARQIGLVWDDMNKFDFRKLPGSGGIAVMLGFVAGVFVYVAFRVLYLGEPNGLLVQVFALLTTVLLLGGFGFIDDLLGWRKGGLSKRSRLILVLVSSIPLVVINAGKQIVNLPFFGVTDLGLFYTLFAIPIGIVGATTTYNFLAGFNGLEAGQGIIFLSALAVVSYFTGSSWLAVVALCMIAALLAFLFFNFCPAKVFPGDSLTYSVGGLIAIIAILGNFEKIAVFFFIPYILEVILKARGGLKKYSFGKPMPDGSLDLKYERIYSLNHAAIALMKKLRVKPTERGVLFCVWTFQIIVILIGFLIFRNGIFS